MFYEYARSTPDYVSFVLDWRQRERNSTPQDEFVKAGMMSFHLFNYLALVATRISAFPKKPWMMVPKRTRARILLQGGRPSPSAIQELEESGGVCTDEGSPNFFRTINICWRFNDRTLVDDFKQWLGSKRPVQFSRFRTGRRGPGRLGGREKENPADALHQLGAWRLSQAYTPTMAMRIGQGLYTKRRWNGAVRRAQNRIDRFLEWGSTLDEDINPY